jgi:hypothetical protein
MARHATTKSTPKGKHTTCCRKQTRRIKFASPALDIPALEHELVRRSGATQRGIPQNGA